MNSVLPGDHEAAGYGVSGGSNAGVGDVYAAQVVENGMQLPYPTTAGGYNLLYAPTLHGGNGNCLEMSTIYYQPNTFGSTYQELGVYDFCQANPGFAYREFIDSNFLSKYVRVYSNGNGMPQYVAEIAEGTDLRWHAYIYNNNNGLWDDVYDSAPGVMATNANNGEAWDIFETYLDAGSYCTGAANTCSNCPSTGTTGSSGFRLHFSNTPHQDWQYADYASYFVYPGDSCFGAGGDLSPYWALTTSAYDMTWEVQSF